VLDDERFKAEDSMSYFDELQERICEIRISERFFYQKIKDIYTTSIDYDAKSDKTSHFFKVVQNKPLIIQHKTFANIFLELFDRPNSELRTLWGIYPITQGDNHF
jgi:hypothetical protein